MAASAAITENAATPGQSFVSSVSESICEAHELVNKVVIDNCI